MVKRPLIRLFGEHMMEKRIRNMRMLWVERIEKEHDDGKKF